MPEMPEVHTIVEDLKKAELVGQTIKRVDVFWPKTVGHPDVQTFIKTLQGKKIEGLCRRGKYLILQLSHHYDLVIHLRMTGRLLLSSIKPPETPYIRLILTLDHQQLAYHDTRKFGRWYLVSDFNEFLKKIGPEPLASTFSLSTFHSLISHKKRALKPLLLDQAFIAGLGNIYVDEALWEAALHPLRKADSLSQEEQERLYEAIRYVLQRGIDSQGTTLGKGKTNYYRLDGQKGNHQTKLSVFRRTGLPCLRCGHPVERIIVAQRSTHICPHCQR